MNPALIGVGVVGALALLAGRKHDATDKPQSAAEVKAEVKRIVKESREIVQGKRDSYSDNPGKKVTAREAAERTKRVLDKAKDTIAVNNGAEDAMALEAARQAAEQDAMRDVQTSPAPKPKSKPKPVLRPEPVVRPAPIFATTTAPKPPKPQPVASRPEGYDETKARNSALGLARHIKKANYNYERAALKAWQRVAGIAQDGVYGPAAANALKYFTAEAPKKLFAKARDGTLYPNTPYPPPEWS